jgi:hypothetical protein
MAFWGDLGYLRQALDPASKQPDLIKPQSTNKSEGIKIKKAA